MNKLFSYVYILNVFSAYVLGVDVMLNPKDKQEHVKLSYFNLVAEGSRFPDGSASVNDSVRANTGRTEGRFYFEVRVRRLGENTYHAIGVATSNFHLELTPGSDDLGCGYRPDGGVDCNNRETSAQYSPYGTGDVIGVAVDLTAEKMYFSKNGVWQGPKANGAAVGLPIRRTGQMYFPVINLSFGDRFRARFKRSSFLYKMPVGYEPLSISMGSWIPFNFGIEAMETPCKGKKFVNFNSKYKVWVGAILCSNNLTYKLVMSSSLAKRFREIADTAGNGQDHCELVSPRFSIPNEDEITSGGCSECAVGDFSWEGPKTLPYFTRGNFGEKFVLSSDKGNNYSPITYSCGVSIP